VEDDYHAEYRYDRAAKGALQGLDPDRVVYAGSASKTLSPACVSSPKRWQNIGELLAILTCHDPRASAERG
jgi:DNA-binding transcriptional MocR family regulator